MAPAFANSRVSAEPPCHVDCAKYAAAICPYVVKSHRDNREQKHDLPVMTAGSFALSTHVEMTRGVDIMYYFTERCCNPGIVVVAICRRWRAVRDGDSYRFDLVHPIDTIWYCDGHAASKDEAIAAMNDAPVRVRFFQCKSPLLRIAHHGIIGCLHES